MADDLLSQNTGSSEIKKVVDSMSNQEALELRIYALKRFSDEALSDLYLSTLELRIKNKCEMSTDNP